MKRGAWSAFTERGRLWRYGWLAYWLAFALYTLDAAHDPGLVRHRETVPYPWAGALITCALLGIETAALSAVLRPLRDGWSRKRALGVCALALFVALASTATLSTDLPGYYYAPALFALTNTILVPLLSVAPRAKSER